MDQHSQAAYSREMHEELVRTLFVATTLFSIVFGQVIVITSEIRRAPADTDLVGMAISLVPLCVWLLLRQKPWQGVWALIVFWTAMPVAMAFSLESPELLAALALPVGLLVLNAGLWPALTFAVGASLPLLWGTAHLSHLASAASIWSALGLAWVSMHFADAAAHWSWASYARMRDLLEESREQQLHLKEVHQDLNLANAELARVSDRLQAMNRIADEARRAKEEFVANVSHELRTPLNMIIGFSEIITEYPRLYDRELPPQLLADIEVIHRNSRHLASLVDDVLDLSRAEAGRMALTREYVSMREVIEASLTVVRPLFESKNLSLSMDVAEDLPPVYCDGTRIRQVVINLLSNAGRFTEKGGAHVRAVQDGRSVVITVADTGPGVPPEEQERIFEPFEQYSGGTVRAFGGSGLGLSISRRFIEMHGGRMWLTSELGRGSTFAAVLPLDVTPPLATDRALRWFNPYETYESRTRPWQAPPPVLRTRVVVMEQTDTLQHILERYEPDIEVLSTRNLDTAVAELSRLPARALLVNDGAQPTGWQDAERAESLPYRTPLIRCAIADRAEAAEHLRVVAYLVKPVLRESLFSALAQLGRPIHSALVVDDNLEALQLFSRMLASAEQPIEVYRANSGGRALTLMRNLRPDVVLLDLVMPEMDGFAVLRAQSEDEAIHDIPVIAISALDTAQRGYTTPYLTVSRAGGINLQELFRCTEALTEILAPPDAWRNAEAGIAPTPVETLDG